MEEASSDNRKECVELCVVRSSHGRPAQTHSPLPTAKKERRDRHKQQEIHDTREPSSPRLSFNSIVNYRGLRRATENLEVKGIVRSTAMVREASEPCETSPPTLNKGLRRKSLSFLSPSSPSQGKRGPRKNSPPESPNEAPLQMIEPDIVVVPLPDLRRITPQRRESLPGIYAVDGAGEYMMEAEGSDNELEVTTSAPEVGLYNSNLVEARLVREDSNMMEAQPCDVTETPGCTGAHKRKRAIVMVVVVVVSATFLAVSLGAVRPSQDSTIRGGISADTMQNKTTLHPPLENLDLLYDDLPEETKERLSDFSTPQYQAWEWLYHHQNITNLDEWRKKQLFALGTFYFSMDGPLWPELIKANWLNDHEEECTWITTDTNLLRGWANQYLRTAVFDDLVYQCNDAGEVQTIFLMNLGLEATSPHLPPEIALLPSLSAIGLYSAGIDLPLSDFLPQELCNQLDHLKLLNLHANNLHGTVPPDCLGQMTDLTHLLFSQNVLVGRMPTELGLLTKLREASLQDNRFMGSMPSEVGLMTSLTALTNWKNTMTGTLPSQVWSLSKLRVLHVGENQHSGSISSEIGLMSHLEELSIDATLFTGSIPSELGRCKLEKAWLENNGLSGTIPSELGMWRNRTRVLFLNSNSLSGVIPPEFWQLTELKQLDLTNLPLLSGTVPEHFCNRMSNSSCYFQLTPGFPLTDKCFLNFDCSGLLCGCGCHC